MLHPVGKLPAAVYWRRRVVLLTLLLAVLGGAGWLGVTVLVGRDSSSSASSAGGSARPVPALERVVPSLSAVATPTPPLVAAAPGAVVAASAVPEPVAGGPCTDDMIGLEVRAPGSATAGDKPTFELLVGNLSSVPCVRALDQGLQELVLYDLSGNRLWGSNDCFPEASSDPRTLAPGEVVSLPVVWSGLTSEPTCTAERGTPAVGNYLLRGRLDTKVSADLPFALQ